MNHLIDAFEGLFTAASKSGGDLAKTAGFVLENVNWEGQLEQPEPTSQRVVDKHLVAACANSGATGSSSRKVADALLAVSDQLQWREYTTAHDDEPDIALFFAQLFAHDRHRRRRLAAVGQGFRGLKHART